MARGRVIPPDVIAAVALYAREGFNAAEIRDELSRDKQFADRVPELRTTQRLVKEFRARMSGEPWQFLDSGYSHQDARNIVSCLAEVIRATHGKRQSIYEDEARIIARIMHAVPGMSGYEAFLFAGEYLVRQQENRDCGGLDSYLGFRAIFGDEDQSWKQRYKQALSNHEVIDPPVWWSLDGAELWLRRVGQSNRFESA